MTLEYTVNDRTHRTPSYLEYLGDTRLVAALDQVAHRFLEVRCEARSGIIAPGNFLDHDPAGPAADPSKGVFQVNTDTTKVQVPPVPAAQPVKTRPDLSTTRTTALPPGRPNFDNHHPINDFETFNDCFLYSQ